MKEIILHVEKHCPGEERIYEHTVYKTKTFFGLGEDRYFYERKMFYIFIDENGEDSKSIQSSSIVEITYSQFSDIRNKLLEDNL